MLGDFPPRQSFVSENEMRHVKVGTALTTRVFTVNRNTFSTHFLSQHFHNVRFTNPESKLAFLTTPGYHFDWKFE
jgi:hypothetical protein